MDFNQKISSDDRRNGERICKSMSPNVILLFTLKGVVWKAYVVEQKINTRENTCNGHPAPAKQSLQERRTAPHFRSVLKMEMQVAQNQLEAVYRHGIMSVWGISELIFEFSSPSRGTPRDGEETHWEVCDINMRQRSGLHGGFGTR